MVFFACCTQSSSMAFFSLSSVFFENDYHFFTSPVIDETKKAAG